MKQLREYTTTIPIRPKSAPRPRFSRQYGAYNETSYTLYKDTLRKFMPHWRTEKKVHVEITFVFAIPKNTSKAKRIALMGTYCDIKKDLDNLEKACYDSMNKHVFLDDNQIVSNKNCKRYGEENQIIITIQELEEEICNTNTP